MDKFRYDMFCEYRSKYIHELFAKSDIYKIGKNENLDTLCNIRRLNDISVFQNQMGYSSAQKYNVNCDSLNNLNYNKILLTYNQNNTIKYSALIEFDFENEVVYINGKKFKVVEDSEYTYKFLKTKIKAVHGVFGLYQYCLKELGYSVPLLFINVLNKISTK